MKISKKIKDRLVDSLISAFTFAAALAWRSTLLEVLDKLFPEDNSIWSEILVTTLLTIIVIFLIYTLLKGDKIINDHVVDESEEGKK